MEDEKYYCVVCGKELCRDKDLCVACLDFLKLKYSNEKERKKVLQWHKKNASELNEES